MSKLLSNSSAEKLGKLLGTNRIDKPRELPPPRDLWVRGTGTGWQPDAEPGGSSIGAPVSNTQDGYYVKCYAFECWKTDAAELTMQPGDVFLGPLTWIEWGSITNATTTPAVNSGDAYVWLEVTAGKVPAAAMVVGSKSAMQNALDSTEQETKTVCPLVMTEWTDGVITKVKNLQCGDVKLFRAAG